MKKCFAFLSLLLIIPLVACTVKEAAADCISDCGDIPPIPAFCLNAELPEDTVMAAMTADGQRIIYIHDDFTVCKEVIRAGTAQDALEALTGRSQEELKAVSVAQYPQEEYRYSCTAAGENGAEVCTGVLFFDGTHGYSLQINCDAAAEKHYRTVFSELLEGTTLDAV